MPAPVAILPLTGDRHADVEQLLDRTFGSERRGRTAYAVRGAADPVAGLGFMALDGAVLVGSIQCWPVALAADSGESHPLVMVGPVAVAPEHQQDGIGRRLTTTTLAAAADLGMDGALMLIGDPEYYGRFFGFTAERTGQWRLPGPVEAHRLLARGAVVPDRPGLLGPRITVPA